MSAHTLLTAEEYVALTGRPLHRSVVLQMTIAVTLSHAFRICECSATIQAATYQQVPAMHADHLAAVVGARRG